MGRSKSSRGKMHQRIKKYKNKITKEFVIEGKEEFLYPNSIEYKYFHDMIYDYKRCGILITKKEDTAQGTIFEMELME